MVLPGAVLHAQTAPESHLGAGGGVGGSRRVRAAGGVLGKSATLGGEPEWTVTGEVGDRSRYSASRLLFDILDTGVLAVMRLLLLLVTFSLAAMAAKDTCVECHNALGGDLQAPVQAFAVDVHKRAGFSCADCHGGDRNSEDYEVSMSKARGYQGKIARAEVPKLCGRCHSDGPHCTPADTGDRCRPASRR